MSRFSQFEHHTLLPCTFSKVVIRGYNINMTEITNLCTTTDLHHSLDFTNNLIGCEQRLLLETRDDKRMHVKRLL